MADADEKRVKIWVVLSDLFCDTEPEYHSIARALKGNTVENLKSIFFEEVAPICGPNLMTPIPPIWSGFAEQQLVDDITEMLDKKNRSFIARVFYAATCLFMRFLFRGLWRDTEEKLRHYWTRPVPQPRQLASLAWEAVMREEAVFQKFFPGAANRSANPFTPFPDRMLSYLTRCVALGMDHQEHPEGMASLFKEARLDAAEAMGVSQSPHGNEFLKTLGAAAAAAGCLLARECPIQPETISSLVRQIAPGPSPDKGEAEDVYTFECYLIGLDADSPETHDWDILATLLRLISGPSDTGTAAAHDEAEMQPRGLATEARARIRDALGTSEEKVRLKTELALWEFVPQANRTQLALALYYKSLNLLEIY